MTATNNPQKRIRPWKPTPRDQAIYQAVVIGGRTQAQAGAEFGRSQSAVSRLLRRWITALGQVRLPTFVRHTWLLRRLIRTQDSLSCIA